jgi:hypothetical protein
VPKKRDEAPAARRRADGPWRPDCPPRLALGLDARAAVFRPGEALILSILASAKKGGIIYLSVWGWKGIKMPLQVRSKEEAEGLIEKATEIRVVKGKGDSVKLKMRTPKALYTFITTADEASAMTKGLKTPIIDF